MLFKAVIFDFDGLMIDSERIALRVWQELTATHGRDMTDEINRLLIGKAPDVGAVIVRDALDLPIPPEVLRKTYWELRTARMCLEAQPAEGLEALLRYLDSCHIRLGVASNSSTSYVIQVLEALGMRSWFGTVIGSDQVQRGKPEPDVYLETARLLGCKPDETLALEDSPTGVMAAVRAGMICYAIPNPNLEGEDFSQADALFPSLSGLLEFLTQEQFGQEHSAQFHA